MSRLRFVEPDLVRVPLSDGDWIEVKRQLTAGEQREIFAMLVKNMHAGERAELNPSKVGKTKLLAYIVNWSFAGPDGVTVPFSESALDSLDVLSYNELSAAIDAHELQTTLDLEKKRATPST